MSLASRPTPGVDPVLLARIRRGRRSEFLFAAIGLLVLLIGIGTLFTLLVQLLLTGLPHIDLDFLTSYPSRRASQAGILSAWVGTCLVMLVTAAIAVPLGIAAGVYLEEYASDNLFTQIVEINISNLAGVPSIIYGLLALGLFVYAFGFGETILTAGLVLGLLIMPVVIVATREAIRSIPREVREGAYALGADKWQVTRMFILPAAKPGILTGVIVGMARAIGETAPLVTIGALTFIAFLPPPPFRAEFPWLSFDWLWSPFTVLPIQVFNWVSRPQTEFHELAAAAAVVLLALTLLMNAFAIWIRYRARRHLG
ncbi:Phosphate transport system permease protein PstA [bacterium HR40]|nr:Phosphate transport system permease protein PstA [bacterium HR40]